MPRWHDQAHLVFDERDAEKVIGAGEDDGEGDDAQVQGARKNGLAHGRAAGLADVKLQAGVGAADSAELLRLRARGRAARDEIRRREEALDLMSFGTGPARCPGAYFNWHESLLVLDALCTRYTFELEHPEREVGPSDHPLIGPEAGMIGVRIRPRVAATAGGAA